MWRMPSRILLVTLLVGLAAEAPALDQPIDGLTLAASRASSGKERLLFESTDPDILFPDFESADDPTIAGAVLDLISPVEGLATLTLPADPARWKRRGGAVDTYLYRSRVSDEDALVRRVVLRRGAGLKVVTRRTALEMASAHGELGLRWRTGSLRSCSLFDASSVMTDVPGRFLATGAQASAASDCQDQTLGAPSACGNYILEAGEECDLSQDSVCPGRCQNTCTCQTGQDCNVLTPCPEEQFCEMLPGICASALDAGACIDVGEACITQWDPVCGCDGITYGNDCERRVARVQKASHGACIECVNACDCESRSFTEKCPLLPCPNCGEYWTCEDGACVANCGQIPGGCEER